MASPVNPPRGMRDFLPADKARREHALSVIRRVYTQHGFDEVETPMVEDSARLHSGLGGDNEKLAFGILRRGLGDADFAKAAEEGSAESLTDLGLRFDLTVPLARFYATHRAELPGVFRSIQVGPVWRAERPQKGRYRQFVQADIDIIGEPSQLAEIELITATSATLAELGLRDCVIRINDRRILFGLLEHCGFPADLHDSALISIDKLDKIGTAGVVAELAERSPAAAAVLESILITIEPHVVAGGVPLSEQGIRSLLPAGMDPVAVDELVALGAALVALPDGVELRFDPTLVRGMGYYTGTIFEIAHPESGSSVGGGGRYDGMIGRFLGQDVPAAGFSIGFERIVDLVDLTGGGAADAVALVYDRDFVPATLVSMKAELIAAGSRVRVEKRAKNLKLQLERLAEAGFTRFAFVSAATSSVSALELKPLT
ncbi:histidine--tRNA ligase [Lysinibacter cavernae]|uniref:Histidine--tRNA ligase n=1 Tax=Lysinibacter cavernae TaxID=1640652 RepID=A0A7X5QY73_9MICO|nr:histidine--tRNA ligase [Lysinibacter cavernae]NIH52138.1 histidyl-tRNA synthetase [Lysinibacter cavernae]